MSKQATHTPGSSKGAKPPRPKTFMVDGRAVAWWNADKQCVLFGNVPLRSPEILRGLAMWCKKMANRVESDRRQA